MLLIRDNPVLRLPSTAGAGAGAAAAGAGAGATVFTQGPSIVELFIHFHFPINRDSRGRQHLTFSEAPRMAKNAAAEQARWCCGS
jgi:hypothetical protein